MKNIYRKVKNISIAFSISRTRNLLTRQAKSDSVRLYFNSAYHPKTLMFLPQDSPELRGKGMTALKAPLTTVTAYLSICSICFVREEGSQSFSRSPASSKSKIPDRRQESLSSVMTPDIHVPSEMVTVAKSPLDFGLEGVGRFLLLDNTPGWIARRFCLDNYLSY